MQKAYSVGQINAYIKNMFTQDFVLRRIYVKGEVSNCKYHTSGHIYFSLKDETGAIACVMFAGSRKGLGFHMENGQQVVVLGGINVYERDGRYQLYASEIILDGAGLLYEKFVALKRELEEMGMFASDYKQPIPRHVKKLGVVTAPTGAAIRDIMNISTRRNPYVQLILYPALVQGEGAAESIVKGIRLLDEYGVDLMIVGRGGGSIEDLWAFNEEKVARAIFECATPVISAVGHETDTTIADYVADLRAPTPSAAAELAVEDIRQTQQQILQYQITLERLLAGQIREARSRLEQYRLKVGYLSPENQIREKRQQLAELEERLGVLMEGKVTTARHRMMLYVEKLRGLSPLDKLKQGYAFAADEENRKVTSVSQVEAGSRMRVYVSDGCLITRVEEKEG
ncbi:MAG: exodeoxyribonuclease VII large subunit [Lachnospiraceae bacterium]|jgi:exodeoxyribonuclease VII large subunit|nr:exodeoxyribonuclease VII large subunit [Lachnospiraceae bacterium]